MFSYQGGTCVILLLIIYFYVGRTDKHAFHD